MRRFLRRALKFLRLMTSPVWRRGLRHGVGASIEHNAALKLLSPAMIVDIGANRGQFALFCADRFPNAHIISFEPLAEPAACYRRVFAGMSNVRLVEEAIGPEETETQIHISKRDDSSSLLPISKLQSSLFPGTELLQTATIRAATLGASIDAEAIIQPALLKIDVQGFELEALEGCKDLLPQFRWAYVECSFLELYEGQSLAPAVIAFLEDQGFRQTGEFNRETDKSLGPVQADFLFER
jgi:FkbM family methyltransferase